MLVLMQVWLGCGVPWFYGVVCHGCGVSWVWCGVMGVVWCDGVWWCEIMWCGGMIGCGVMW